jgi:hypothetical protein
MYKIVQSVQQVVLGLDDLGTNRGRFFLIMARGPKYVRVAANNICQLTASVFCWSYILHEEARGGALVEALR